MIGLKAWRQSCKISWNEVQYSWVNSAAEARRSPKAQAKVRLLLGPPAMNNIAFIAVNGGGVIVNKEVAVGVDDATFVERLDVFKRRNYGFCVTFFTQAELVELLKRFDKK